MPDALLIQAIRDARDDAIANVDFDGDAVKAKSFVQAVRKMILLIPQDATRETERVRQDIAQWSALLKQAERTAISGTKRGKFQYFDVTCRE